MRSKVRKRLARENKRRLRLVYHSARIYIVNSNLQRLFVARNTEHGICVVAVRNVGLANIARRKDIIAGNCDERVCAGFRRGYYLQHVETATEKRVFLRGAGDLNRRARLNRRAARVADRTGERERAAAAELHSARC